MPRFFISPSTYRYDDTDFTNEAVNTQMLVNEILDNTILDSGSKTASSIDTECDSSGELHYVYIVMSSVLNTSEETALDTVVAAHLGTSTSDTPQHVESAGESTESAGTWTDKLSHTCSALKQGRWCFTIGSEIKMDGVADEFCEVRFRYAAADYVFNFNEYNKYQAVGRNFAMNIKEGATPSIALRFCKTGTGSGTAYIRRAQIQIHRIGDYAYSP